MALFVVMASYSCKNKTDKAKEKPPTIVDVIIAEKSNFSTNIKVNGSALSEEMVELQPEISGKLVYLNIPDGELIAEGTLLAKINDAELQAELEQYKTQFDLAEKTEKRLKKLLEVNGVNQSDYDAAINQVSLVYSNIKMKNAQIDKTVIKAPFSGRIGLRLVSLGAYVTPQTMLGTLQQTDKIKIDFTVPEKYSSIVAVGNYVTVITNSSEEKLQAVISAIEPQINSDTRNIKVERD